MKKKTNNNKTNLTLFSEKSTDAVMIKKIVTIMPKLPKLQKLQDRLPNGPKEKN
jgi:hypothetical protein